MIPAVVLCAVLPLLFGALALSAARTKCATMDEPLHAVGGWLHVFHRDWRINPEDPPLWNYWAMLPHGRAALRVNFDDPDWAAALRNSDYQTRITTRTLYQTPGNDGAAFIDRSRMMMAVLGVALGGVIAAFAWRLGGAVAAVVAVVLYSLDPNFLAHAPLVKNDVTISLLLLAVSFATWSVGRRLAGWKVLVLGLLCGAAAATKYSGLLVGPAVVGALLIRALLPAPWPLRRRELRSRGAKLGAAIAVSLLCAILGITVVWASYGFRFEPTAIPGARLDLETQVLAARQNRFFTAHGRFATDVEIAQHPPQAMVRAALAAERARLLPHAYFYGFLYTYQTSLLRMAYLLGELKPTGWGYYFPLAMLFKTPLATLAAGLVALEVLLLTRGKRKSQRADHWTLVSLLTLPGIYALSALSSNLNLGLRHVLPLYPFMYILIGLAGAVMWRHWRRVFWGLAAAIGIGLGVETAVSFPHYIPFFNALARPHALKLLSDSNLDWGQDLPLLAEWRRRHPHVRLYLSYFGSVDPAFYGIDDYINLPPGFFLGPRYQWATSPGVIAVSATYLQGNHMSPDLRAYYAPLREQAPRAILGASIYLYDYGPSQP